jgi:hypothetical protein
MNIAHNLLDDLTGIGATIEPAGDRLILRAGPTAIPATLVSRIRRAKRELMAALVARKDSGALRTDDDHRREKEIAAPLQSEDRTFRHRPFEDFVVQPLHPHRATVHGVAAPSRPVPGWCRSVLSLGHTLGFTLNVGLLGIVRAELRPPGRWRRWE